MADTITSKRAHFHGVITGLVRDDELAGRPQLVVPAVLVREMVLGNNGDGELLPRAAIAASVEFGLWNGRPVTLDHPVKHGQFTLVGDLAPAILQDMEVGRLFNVHESGGKLKGEVWVDVQAASRTERGQQLVAALQAHRDGEANGHMIEVSTGYLASVRSESGSFGGRRYHRVEEEIIPDHLAILLDGKGKCSVEDGCGLPRLNAEGLSDNDLTEEESMQNQSNEDGIARRVMAAIANAFSAAANDKGAAGEGTGGAARSALDALTDAGMSFEDISAALADIGEVDGEDVTRTGGVLGSIARGEIENPPQSLVDALERIDPPEQEETTNMNETVNALAEIEGFPLTVEQLNELDEDRIGKLAKAWGVGADGTEPEADPPPAVDPPAADTAPAPAANAADDGHDCGCPDIEQFVNALGLEDADEAKRIFDVGREELARREAERVGLAKELAANEDCHFTAERLNAMGLEDLKALEASIVRQPVFAARGGPRSKDKTRQVRACTPPIVSRKPQQQPAQN